VPAGEEPGADVLARVEGALPRHVHEVRGPRAPEPDHSASVRASIMR
jgi:hypothetical protein